MRVIQRRGQVELGRDLPLSSISNLKAGTVPRIGLPRHARFASEPE